MSNPARESHRYAVRMCSVLDELVRKEKAGWLARVTGISETVLSECRKGTRNLPAYRVPLVDEAMGSHALLEELAAMEGCGIYSLDPKAITASDLERLFPQIIREEGHVNGDVFEALQDGEIDTAERAHLHAHFAKLRQFFQDAEERTAPIKETAPVRARA